MDITDQNNEYRRRIDELTLMDRLLFAEVIENQEFAEICLSIIMNEEQVLKSPPQAEKEIRNLETGKYIILDSFMENEEECVFDMEVQKLDNRDLPRRSRNYQGMVDSKLLKPGESDFNSMKDMCLIIISSFDPYKKGHYCYSFGNQCNEIEGLLLNDGGKRIFLNTKGRDEENISHELKWMLRYFEKTTNEVAEMSNSRRIIRMNEIVNEVKKSIEFKRMTKSYLEDMADERSLARKEGHAEGHAEACAEMNYEHAAKMKKDGMPTEQIMRYVDMTKAAIEAIPV